MFIVSNFLLKIILPIAVSAIGTFFKLFVKSLTKNFYLLRDGFKKTFYKSNYA